MPVYKDDRRTALTKLIESSVTLEREKLLRPELQDLGFKSAEVEIDRLRRLLAKLLVCDFDLLSDNKISGCNQFVTDVNQLFSRMNSFLPSRATTAPAMERDQILQQCVRLNDQSNERLETVFAVASPTLQEIGQEVRLILDGAKSSTNTFLEQAKSEADKARSEVEATLQSVRAATGAIGIEKQAEVFKNAATENATGRKRWLVTTVALAVATAGGLLTNWAMAYKMGPPATSIALLQLTVAKVLVFSFFLSAVVWSGKVYRSYQHNYVLNKHRQNALETFQLFARAAEHDPETKGMVLLQATKSIFVPQATGFLSGERESDAASPQILEIIRSLGGASKP